jgi:hypothetical protein
MTKLLDQADNLQQKTKEAVNRISTNIADIDNIANLTLEELRANSQQIDETINKTNIIDKNLDISEKLKNKFSMLNGNFFNFNFFRKTNGLDIKPKVKNIAKTEPNNSSANDILLLSNTKPSNQYEKFVDIQVGSDNLANRLNKINLNDQQIDQSLDSIANFLDAIMGKTQLMKEEVVQQNHKLDILDSNMSHVVSKQDKISTDLKNILRKK